MMKHLKILIYTKADILILAILNCENVMCKKIKYRKKNLKHAVMKKALKSKL